MNETLLVFKSTFINISQVFLVVFFGGLLVRVGVIKQAHIGGLSAVTVAVFLPCLIFSDITKHFRTETLPIWWVIPLAAIGMFLFGLGLSSLAFLRELPEKKSMLSLASIQNAGYLVLPVGKALFPDRFDSEFSVYCFLFILGISPILWSVGKYLTTSGQGDRVTWRAFCSPPFAANVLAIFFVFTGLRNYIPGPAAKSVGLLGDAAVPVATFVLGASLGSIHLHLRSHLFDAVRALGIKLVMIPLATILVLRLTGLKQSHEVLASFFVIEAASAPATATILQVRNYGGDEQKIGSILFLGYILCAVTLPFWFALWNILG